MFRFCFIIIFLCNNHATFSQFNVKNNDWRIENYSGSCYFDTLIHAIWIQILPNVSAYYLNEDTTYLVAKAEVVNKSPLAIYVRGDANRLCVDVIKEWFEPVYPSPQNYNKHNSSIGAASQKLRTESTYNFYQRGKFPFRDLLRNDTSFIQIPSGKRKVLYFPLPKYSASYRLEAEINFNKEKYWYDCSGQRVGWDQFRTIQSNKIDLVWRDTLLLMNLDSVKGLYGEKFLELREIINNRDPLDFLYKGEPKDQYEEVVKLIIVQLKREMNERQILDLLSMEFRRWHDYEDFKPDYIELSLDIKEWLRK